MLPMGRHTKWIGKNETKRLVKNQCPTNLIIVEVLIHMSLASTFLQHVIHAHPIPQNMQRNHIPAAFSLHRPPILYIFHMPLPR